MKLPRSAPLVALLIVGSAGCYTLGDADPVPDDADLQPSDDPEDPPAADDDDDDGDDDVPADPDVATVVDFHLPSALPCDGSFDAEVVVRNDGRATWTRDDGYKLGAVDDSDPLFGDRVRVRLGPDDVVPPGSEHTFSFVLQAPAEPGTYRTDWRMVHEAVGWFGDVAAADVAVECPSLPPLDLGDVHWLHSDVSGWDEVAVLDSVTVSGGTICLDYDHADVWSSVIIGGDTAVVGNPWIFIYEDDRWYGATWEWLRPGQTCKNAASVAGDHIKRAPFDADSGWTPTSGQTYYFMVSGLARFSERNALERTNVVEVVWP